MKIYMHKALIERHMADEIIKAVKDGHSFPGIIIDVSGDGLEVYASPEGKESMLFVKIDDYIVIYVGRYEKFRAWLNEDIDEIRHDKKGVCHD